MNTSNPFNADALGLNPFIPAAALANGTQANSLLVNTSTPTGRYNVAQIVTGESASAPDDLQVGVREVYLAKSGTVIIVITGVDTSNRPGRWINSYISGNGWAGWQRETTGPLAVHGTIQNLSAVGGVIYASLCGTKYPSVRKVDLHISCGIATAPTDTATYALLDMGAVRDKLGVSTLTWDAATQSRVIVESAADYGASAGLWGLAGLRLSVGGAICRQYATSNLATVGSWAAGTASITRAGNYLHIDVWGADYT